jgi:hypothetical protein
LGDLAGVRGLDGLDGLNGLDGDDLGNRVPAGNLFDMHEVSDFLSDEDREKDTRKRAKRQERAKNKETRKANKQIREQKRKERQEAEEARVAKYNEWRELGTPKQKEIANKRLGAFQTRKENREKKNEFISQKKEARESKKKQDEQAKRSKTLRKRNELDAKVFAKLKARRDWTGKDKRRAKALVARNTARKRELESAQSARAGAFVDGDEELENKIGAEIAYLEKRITSQSNVCGVNAIDSSPRTNICPVCYEPMLLTTGLYTHYMCRHVNRRNPEKNYDGLCRAVRSTFKENSDAFIATRKTLDKKHPVKPEDYIYDHAIANRIRAGINQMGKKKVLELCTILDSRVNWASFIGELHRQYHIYPMPVNKRNFGIVLFNLHLMMTNKIDIVRPAGPSTNTRRSNVSNREPFDEDADATEQNRISISVFNASAKQMQLNKCRYYVYTNAELILKTITNACSNKEQDIVKSVYAMTKKLNDNHDDPDLAIRTYKTENHHDIVTPLKDLVGGTLHFSKRYMFRVPENRNLIENSYYNIYADGSVIYPNVDTFFADQKYTDGAQLISNYKHYQFVSLGLEKDVHYHVYDHGYVVKYNEDPFKPYDEYTAEHDHAPGTVLNSARFDFTVPQSGLRKHHVYRVYYDGVVIYEKAPLQPAPPQPSAHGNSEDFHDLTSLLEGV